MFGVLGKGSVVLRPGGGGGGEFLLEGSSKKNWTGVFGALPKIPTFFIT